MPKMLKMTDCRIQLGPSLETFSEIWTCSLVHSEIQINQLSFVITLGHIYLQELKYLFTAFLVRSQVFLHCLKVNLTFVIRAEISCLRWLLRHTLALKREFN